ncbi:MAG: alpha/beta hydrolase [Lachnospiraceae bacterium]|nr:alpha/beta hydrolase [Lachnospiraceae bacterium]
MQILKKEITAGSYTALLTCYIRDYYDSFDKDRKRPAILVCPGGAYQYTSEREAEPVALKFSGMGYQTFVLDYSCSPTGAEYPTALTQALASIKYIRENAEEWHIDPKKITVMGFSAGGHLAANVSVDHENEAVLKAIGAKKNECRPDACVLCYPVISSGKWAHRGSIDNLMGSKKSDELQEHLSLENRVNTDTPPTFLWHTWADGSVPVQNTLLYALALKDKNVTAEVHIFPFGGHGLSLANAETSYPAGVEIQDDCTIWPELADRFLREVTEER